LISELELISEPVVLVVFGDHLPGIEPESAIDEITGDVYKTEYLMWSNFETDCIIKELESYQLYSYVLNRLSFEGGAIQKLHRKYSFSENEEYLKKFEVLQYHMLYEAENNAGICINSHTPTNLRFGIRKISVSDVNFVADVMYVHGNNFNSFSKVFADGKELKTVYVDKHTLSVPAFDGTGISEIRVGQVDSNSNLLSLSESFLINSEK